jgi:hypothetical protein
VQPRGLHPWWQRGRRQRESVIHCSAAQADLIEKLVDEHKIVADRLLRAAPGCNVARVTMAAPRRMAHGLLRTRQNASVAGKDARARACICLARGVHAHAHAHAHAPRTSVKSPK